MSPSVRKPLTPLQIVLLCLSGTVPSFTLMALHFHLFVTPLNALVAFLHSF